MTKYQKDPLCSIFLKRGLFKDIKNYIPMCQMRKCKIKCQKDSTCGIFLDRGLFNDIKNHLSTPAMCQWNIRQFDFCTVTTGLFV